MNSFAFLLVCIQVYLVQNVFGQCLGKLGGIAPYSRILDAGIAPVGRFGCGDLAYPAAAWGGAYGYGLDGAYGYGLDGAYGYGLDGAYGYGLDGAYGYGLDAYGGIGEGNVAVAGELPVAGTTAVVGQVPIMGAVRFGGDVAAGGAVSISGKCACGCGCSRDASYWY